MNVQAINTYNSQPSFKQKEMSYKKAFTYVVRNSPCDRKVLTEKIGIDNVKSFSGAAGFIGDVYHTEKYHITKDGIEYYKEIYGVIPYYWHRVTGLICRTILPKKR